MSLGGSSSDNSSQQQAQQQQNFAQSTTGNQAGQYANGPVNAGQLQDALNAGQSLYSNGNALTNAGFSNVNNAAGADTGLFGQGNSQLSDTLNGSYLSAGNPYFNNMVGQIDQGIRPQVSGAFEGAGRYGSGGFANAYTGALANAVAPLAYQNYAAERTNQLGAASQLPSYAAGSFVPGQAQVTAGYAPTNQYIQELSTLKPGTLGSYGQSSNNNASGAGSGSSSGIGTGDASTFGVQTKSKGSN